MSHVYCVNYQHITFHVDRYVIRAEDIQPLHAYMAGILMNKGVKDVKVGGINNHVHIMGNFLRHNVPSVVQQCKGAGNIWLKKRNAEYYHAFCWQTGYFSCAVSYKDVGWIRKYIANQFRHHLNVGVEAELRELKRKNGLDVGPHFM